MSSFLNSTCQVFWAQPVRFSELNLSDFQNSSSQIFWAKPVRFSELNILKIFWTQHVPYSELYEYISHFLTSICQIFRTQPVEYFELNLSNILNSTRQIFWALSLSPTIGAAITQKVLLYSYLAYIVIQYTRERGRIGVLRYRGIHHCNDDRVGEKEWLIDWWGAGVH